MIRCSSNAGGADPSGARPGLGVGCEPRCAPRSPPVNAFYSRFEFLALLTAGGADIIQPDICVVGGMTGDAPDLAALAEAHYVTWSRRTIRWGRLPPR